MYDVPPRGAMSMRSRPGTSAVSYHVWISIVSAGVRRVVFCWNVSVLYHLPAYRSCIARITCSPDVGAWARADPAAVPANASTAAVAAVAATHRTCPVLMRPPLVKCADPSAVDGDRLRRDVRGALRCQERRERGQLVRFA